LGKNRKPHWRRAQIKDLRLSWLSQKYNIAARLERPRLRKRPKLADFLP
jgi:hypothetical protein